MSKAVDGQRCGRAAVTTRNADHYLTFGETRYGIGIRAVISAISKYEGMYDFTAEDAAFSAKIILNFIKPPSRGRLFVQSTPNKMQSTTKSSFGGVFYYNVSKIKACERSDEIDRKEVCG